MSELLAKCGCACSRCPTFKANIPDLASRERCSRGWKTYLNITLGPEKLRTCDGCFADDRDKPTRYLNCIVRKCALRNGIKNCAYCRLFPCEELRHVHEAQDPAYREMIEARIGYAVPEDDYLAFIEPYEGLKHLEQVRMTIGPDDISDIVPFSLKSKIVPFPEKLNHPEYKSYRALHRILASIDAPLEGVSYARRETEKKQRRHLFTLLWTFGLTGRPKAGEPSTLMIDSIEYYTMKNQSQYRVLQRFFETLNGLGLRGTVNPLMQDDWVNARGYMRMNTGKKGVPAWEIELAFGDVALANALHDFVGLLRKKYGDNAFGYFLKGDMGRTLTS